MRNGIIVLWEVECPECGVKTTLSMGQSTQPKKENKNK
jgi:phage terminase large subunit GpA-like protein